MARMARVVVPKHPHHVTQRGARGFDVFFSDADYRLYVQMLAESCEAAGTAIWAWCLMPNHVHLILVPRDADGLRAAIADCHRRYTRHINARESCQGHLWQERFHSFAMDQAHTLAAARYIELNPVRAGLVRTPRQWRWSSARAHLAGDDDALVSVAPLARLVDDWKGFLAEGMETPMVETIERHGRTGRPLGNERFLKAIESKLGRPVRPKKPGPKPKTPKS